MAGTKAGGQKAAATNLKLYGKDFYSRNGKKSKGKPKAGAGFASEKVGPDGLTGRQRAKKVGGIGGTNAGGKTA
jgi:hypothetical protein